MSESAAPTLVPETKSFSGSYLVWRKRGQQLRKGATKEGTAKMIAERERPPRFRHPSFDSAETEAKRLAEICPETTFIIIQEVARVKMKPGARPAAIPPEPRKPQDDDPASAFEEHARWVESYGEDQL